MGHDRGDADLYGLFVSHVDDRDRAQACKYFRGKGVEYYTHRDTGQDYEDQRACATVLVWQNVIIPGLSCMKCHAKENKDTPSSFH